MTKQSRRKKPGKKAVPNSAVRQRNVAPTEADYNESLEHRSFDGKEIQVVSFFLDEDEYAFEVTDAVEVLKPRPCTELPRMPSFLKGILSVRGEMVPVVDLKERLGGAVAGESAAARIIIASVDDTMAGFLVDRMGAVELLPEKFFSNGSGPGKPVGADFINGVIEVDDRRISILDPQRLLDFTAV